MSFALWIALLSLGLFIGMIAAYEVGRRLGVRRLAKEQRDQLPGAGVIEGAVFALLGLLIAFTFQGAASRFDDRRQLIIKEYNAIGTAYLRIDVLAPDEQPAIRASFRMYLDSRLETYRRLPNLAAARAELSRSEEIQQEIWHQAVAGSARSPGPAGILLLPALNQMFDISSERSLHTLIHPPVTIFVMLGLLLLISSMFAGHSTAASKTRSWLHVIGLAVTLAASVYVILDLEYPRLGLIRVDAFDRALIHLRQTME